MTKVKQLLGLIEQEPEMDHHHAYNDLSHDLLKLKSKIHDHERFVRELQSRPDKSNHMKDRISFHQDAINNLKDQIKNKQDRLQKFHHSATGSAGSAAAVSAPHGGSSNVSVNNLGKIPNVALKWRRKKNER